MRSWVGKNIYISLIVILNQRYQEFLTITKSPTWVNELQKCQQTSGEMATKANISGIYIQIKYNINTNTVDSAKMRYSIHSCLVSLTNCYKNWKFGVFVWCAYKITNGGKTILK